MKISRPTEKEYDVNSYQNRYIQAVTGDDALKTIKENLFIVDNFFKNIPQEKLQYRYAEGKWTPQEILGHIIDTERILAYRAMSIARGEKQSLLGFEEDDYVKATNFNKKSLRNLLQQYKSQRKSTILLLNSLNKRELSRMGRANGLPINARVLAWFIAGHELHHINILNERYL
ncbi:MAG: DinB family protein [Spirosomaceae bacterium]|nr:DinB family protein [Spirosomataceae bacterium]